MDDSQTLSEKASCGKKDNTCKDTLDKTQKAKLEVYTRGL